LSQQLPPALLASLQTANGFDEKAFVAIHESGEQITSIRLNPGKIFDTQHSILNIQGKIPWSSNGYYLTERPSFTSDPLFHSGGYYVQEASSMFLEEVIKQTCDLSKPLKVLDLCAAPGGKSTLLQSIISSESLLVSNEVIKTRVNILSENITKWGAANVVVTNNDPKDFQRLPGYFDVIVIDAPCSGSGLFRKDPDAITEWSPDNVILCTQRQQRILADIMPALKPGGILIYSTCSYSKEEDEQICDWLLSGIRYPVSGIQLNIEPDWHIVETKSSKQNAFGYRFYPDKLKGEGFFIAAFTKEGNDLHSTGIKFKDKPVLLDRSEIALLHPLIRNASSFSFFKWQDDILAVPAGLLNDIFHLKSALYLKKAGVKTGSIIRNELIPSHEFALSELATDQVNAIEVDLATALQYLRRADIEVDFSQKGWVLLRYKNLAMGWIKSLANRINNYYPKDWRILNK
jgi:16S rRNA C967 or C1407 C5-methylase (RsmB/RsmF family)/NOL1/NOP2/fmu family ribosome biogenesis protein